MLNASTKRKFVAVATGILTVILVASLQLSGNKLFTSIFSRLELLTYDLRLVSTLPEQPTPSPNIVIIDIDEASLKNEGRWPWPREKMAQLMHRLYAQGVVVAATDVVFAEPQQNPALLVRDHLDTSADPQVRELLEIIAPNMDGDLLLADSLLDRDVVLGYTFVEEGQSVGLLGPPLVVRDRETLDNFSVATMDTYTANIPVIQQAAVHSGFFNVTPDTDGLIRRYNLVIRHQGEIYPSLALESARLFLLADDVSINTADIGGTEVMESITLADYSIPTDGMGAVLVPFHGKSRTFTYIPATDVINSAEPDPRLDNTIALIGSSAKGLFDLRSTPVESVYPGVEVHANVVAGILEHYFPQRPRWADGADLILVLAGGLLLALLMPFLHSVGQLIVTVLAVAGVISVNLWAWTSHGLALSVVMPVSLFFTLALLNLAIGFLIESREKGQLKGMFGQYVPPQLVDEMSRNPDNFGFEGDRREMTVLFADIRSFTTISESLGPGELKDMLNRFFTPMTEIIFNERGTMDKYVGDMIMAFWGAPLKDEQHAANGIRAALKMLAKVDELKPEFKALGLPEVNIGVGLNTGIMNVGNMGSIYRRSYTVLGDSVNLGSRLEGLTKFYGVGLIVGEGTRKDQDEFLFRSLDRVQVKGKNEPISIYEPVCLMSEATPALLAEIERHEQAMAHYLGRQWDEATEEFGALLSEHPHTKVYGMYLERMKAQSLYELPEDWNGVFTHTSK